MKGSIVKRGSTYSIIFDVGMDPKGKRKQKWISGFKTKKAAQIELNKKLVEVQRNTYFESDNRTLADYLREWFSSYVEQNLAINTIQGYRVNIEKHIIPGIGHIPLSKLQPIDV